jgi:hypothetical protein
MSQIAENLEFIRQRIANAAERNGRSAKEVKLVAVSKTYPPEIIREAIEAGQQCFGENRVQDALPKIDALPPDLEWHLIGHLQTNKVRKVIGRFALFHGVDNTALAVQMNRIAEEFGILLSVEGTVVDPEFISHVSLIGGYTAKSVLETLGLYSDSEDEEPPHKISQKPDSAKKENLKPNACSLTQRKFSTVLVTSHANSCVNFTDRNLNSSRKKTPNVSPFDNDKDLGRRHTDGQCEAGPSRKVSKLKDFILETPPKPESFTSNSGSCTPGVISRVKHLLL